jgi:hypothetical protein
MKTFASDLSKGFVSCSRCGVLKSLSEVYIDKDGIVNHSCEKFEKDKMKTEVDINSQLPPTKVGGL